MRRLAMLAGLLLSSGIARADWQFDPPAADKASRGTVRAFVPAKAGNATLVLECVNGTQLLSIKVAEDLARGMIESDITFDERKPKSQLLQIFSKPRDVPLFDISARDLMRTKRIRIDLRPIDIPAASYDFDIRGAKKAVDMVVCSAKPKSLLRRLRGR